jgi:hypothetical protein
MEVIALAAQFKGGRGLNMVASAKPGSFLGMELLRLRSFVMRL